MTTIPISKNQPPRQRLQRRRGRPSLALVLLVLFFFLLPVLHIVSAQDDDFDGESDGNGGYANDPELTGTFPLLDDPTPSPASVPSPPSLTTTPDDASPSVPSPTKSKVPKPTIALPTVLYMPPTAPNMNPNAIDPLFPSGSESCQKCKYFYPKLKECNQIAQQTLGRLPRLPPNVASSASSTTSPLSPSSSSSIIMAATTSQLNSSTTTTSLSAASATYAASTATTTLATNNTTAPAEFTTLMPFLQCICPSQGLAATKVCLTCFQVTNQRNFLDQLVAQNVRYTQLFFFKL